MYGVDMSDWMSTVIRFYKIAADNAVGGPNTISRAMQIIKTVREARKLFPPTKVAEVLLEADDVGLQETLATMNVWSLEDSHVNVPGSDPKSAVRIPSVLIRCRICRLLAARVGYLGT